MMLLQNNLPLVVGGETKLNFFQTKMVISRVTILNLSFAPFYYAYKHISFEDESMTVDKIKRALMLRSACAVIDALGTDLTIFISKKITEFRRKKLNEKL